jgi:hypothetical protein
VGDGVLPCWRLTREHDEGGKEEPWCGVVRGLVSCDGCAAQRKGMVARLCVAVGQADSQRQALGTSGRCKKWVSARLRLWKVDVAMPMRPCV